MPEPVPGPLGPCQAYITVADFVAAVGNDTDEALAAVAVVAASEVVYVLLGRTIHGICTATIETDSECSTWVDGRARLVGSPRHEHDFIVLQTPVVSITSVTVGGVALAPADYVLYDGYGLARTDGGAWVGVVRITYSFGAPIPTVIAAATLELARELYTEGCGRKSCLPVSGDRLSIQRQGIGITVDNNADRAREAGPALPKLMEAMAVWNPGNERTQVEVVDLDDPHPTHTVRTFSV